MFLTVLLVLTFGNANTLNVQENRNGATNDGIPARESFPAFKNNYKTGAATQDAYETM